MGGGTGTGASPVIAAAAKSQGALTIAVVSTPDSMLGEEKVNIAQDGLKELMNHVDSYIVVTAFSNIFSY